MPDSEGPREWIARALNNSFPHPHKQPLACDWRAADAILAMFAEKGIVLAHRVRRSDGHGYDVNRLVPFGDTE